jgi:hypothetical protein
VQKASVAKFQDHMAEIVDRICLQFSKYVLNQSLIFLCGLGPGFVAYESRFHATVMAQIVGRCDLMHAVELADE